MPSLRTIISNSTRLHAHRHAEALKFGGMLDAFVTSLWHKPNQFPYTLIEKLPGSVGRSGARFLSKRSSDILDSTDVIEVRTPELARLGLEVASNGSITHGLHLQQKIAYDWLVARLVRRRKPGCFVGFEISCAQSMKAARKVGAETVLDLAGLDHRFSPLQMLRASDESKYVKRRLAKQKINELANADRIICVSELARRSLCEAGIEPERTSVIRLGLDHNVFRLPSGGFRAKDGPFEFLFVGNLSRAKGVPSLVQAFLDLNLSDCVLRLAGSSADIDIRELSGPNVIFEGFVSGKDLVETYQAADVLVLPTRYDSWGFVIPEAMACGLPVITTDMCGASELLRNDENGWIYEAGNDCALRDVMSLAHEKRGWLGEMGARAAESVQHISWEAYTRSILDFHRHKQQS